MGIIKANRITIFGGGTSGWLTAAYLSNNLKYPHKITLIESTEMGPIGVGEGTQPATARFLHDCGLDPKSWMKPSQAAFKLGVEFVGWTDEDYFVDNDFIENTIIGPDLYTPDYFIDKPKQEFFDWLPAYRMAKNNKSPKLAAMDTNYALSGVRQFGAVHFAAFEIVKAIKNLIEDRIDYYDTKIVDVKQDANGISELIDEEGRTHTADLFIDCTGFSSILLEKTLGVDFESITDLLPCDSAVAMPTQYTDPEKECHPYTRASTMKAGWRWTIPIYTRVGNGYSYSSKYISKEEAEQELRDSIGEYDAKALHLKMKCGIHKKTAFKNVVAAGLSAGFVEPLEATGITFTTKAAEVLTDVLNKNNGVWNQPIINAVNESYAREFWEIVSFVWAHYYFSTRKDTQFWKDRHDIDLESLDPRIKEHLSRFIPELHRRFYVHPESSFHVGHWFSVLHAGGVFKDHPKMIAGDVEKYAEYFLKNQDSRVDLVLDMFPNHYEFLKEWYGD
jgi:hypothetical protein